jgi:hypothetical protein
MVNDVVTWGAVAIAIGAVIAIVKMSNFYSDRITKAEAAAKTATETAQEAKKDLATLRAEHAKEIATLRADYVRDVSALSSKVYQVEIWARDEFVRKASFETVVARLEKGMEQLGQKVEGAVDKMAQRIENMNHHER